MMKDRYANEVLSDQYLLKKNQIYIFGPIETGMAARVIPQMHFIEQKMIEEGLPEEERILTMLINSPGGSVHDGLAIYDTINSLDCHVRTICVGLAASMGAFLLCSGSKGMRLALPNSEILIHQPLGGAQGQATDVAIRAEWLVKTKEKMIRMKAEMTGQPEEVIRRDVERDHFLSAQEALEYGIIDEIFDPRQKK